MSVRSLFVSLFGGLAIKYSYKFPVVVVAEKERKARIKYYKIHDKMIQSVKWSEQDVLKIRNFWSKYGIKKFDDKGFKYFQSVNGVFEPRYITNMLYDTLIERKLNPFFISDFYQKKELSTNLFSNIEGLYLPKTYLKITHSGDFIINDMFIDKKTAIEYCSNIGKVICKPTIGTARGVGVKVIELKNGIDIRSKKDLMTILDEYKNQDLLLQEWVYPSKEMSKLYPYSLGTFRVTTYLLNNNVYCGPIALRQSIGKVEVDGVNCKGYTIGVNKANGTLNKTGYFYDESNQYKMYEHPDTKIKFDGYYVGDIGKMIDVAKKLHSRIPDVGIASWDLSFGQNDQIVFIEVNLMYQGVDINQIATGMPLFEENTDEMLKLIFNKKY